MNQILFIKNNSKKYKIQLVISLIIFITVFLFWLRYYLSTKSEDKFSNSLLNSFNIERIYSNSEGYTVVELDGNSTTVIGIIEIPNINIKYPILSNISDELLKVSPCRFYGPLPNENGNLCIAAHNYDDNRFFGNLHKLNIGDMINIYDSSNNVTHYYVYDKFESSEKDTSCINQDVHTLKELTLITCNNLNKNRLIIKSKAQK
jgi:LPXTG-site transpeptidase (sortase) family protein